MTDYFDQLALAGLFNSENVAKASPIPNGALADDAPVTGAILKQWINQHAAALDPIVYVKPNRAAFALLLKIGFIRGQIGNTRPLATSVAPGFVYMDTGNEDALSWSDKVAWRSVSASETLLDIALFSLRNRIESKVGIEVLDQLKGTASAQADTLGEIEALITALQASLATKLTTADLQAALVDKSIQITQITGLGSQLGQKIDATQKGALNGVATLDGSGKVPSVQLPSYVDDVIEVANYAALPGTGVVSAIYVTLNDNAQYRWGGSSYIELTSSPGSTDAVPEGATNKYFTDARAQAALVTALAAKQATLTALGDVPGLTAALAAKQATLTGVTGVVDPTTGAARALVETDVPALPIARTTGLQAALDAVQPSWTLNHASARLLTPVAGAMVYVSGRTNHGDFGGGLYRARTGTQADNGGTVLVCANGLRLVFAGEYCTPEMFGGSNDNTTSNTAAYNAWAAAFLLGLAPYWYHHPRAGNYLYATAPYVFLDAGMVRVSGIGISSSIVKGFSDTTESGAVFRFDGATQPWIHDFASRNGPTSEGGCIVASISTATASAAFVHIERLYMSFDAPAGKVIDTLNFSAGTTITIANHGYQNGDTVCVVISSNSDAAWQSLMYQQWTVENRTANTFQLRGFASGALMSTLGFPSLSGTFSVKRRMAPHAHIVINGTAKNTGAVGVRGVYIDGCQIFGAGVAGIMMRGAIVPMITRTSFSGAGLNAALYIEGTAAVPTTYLVAAACLLDGVVENFAVRADTEANINQGSHLRSPNSSYSKPASHIAGHLQNAGTKNSGHDIITLGGNRVLVRKLCTGIGPSYTPQTWPVVFVAPPELYGAIPITCPSTATNAITNAASTTGIQVAGQNLSAGGDVLIWAIGVII